VKPFEVARLDELDSVPIGSHGLQWRPVRHRLGIEAFGVNAYTTEAAGQEVVEEHDESGAGAGHHEEVYVVIRGHATFTVAGEEIDAPTGTFVFVRDPAAKRAAVARTDDTAVLAIGGARGQAYQVSPWEYYFAASPLVAAGDHAGAAALVREGLERYPGNPAMLYNLACFEALGGEREAALEHLRGAIATDERYRGYARDDPDFDALRDDPEFVSAVAGEPEPGGAGA
jgi:tetratricopeptide (TPR) repeat protein